MGALVLRKLRNYPDNFAVSTTEVVDEFDGTVAKKSKVEVFATNTAPGDLWFGLRIKKGQSIRLLQVNGAKWIGPNSDQDARAVREFERLFHSGAGEKWVAYRVDQGDIPVGRKYDTILRVKPRIVHFPDVQTVTILVCYIPPAGTPLEREWLLVGHSDIPSPRPKGAKARRRKVRR